MTCPERDPGAAGEDPVDLQPVDLLLEQGAAGQLAAARQRVAADPLLAIEVAETVDLLERFRQVRTEPSPRFAARLYDVVRRAELWRLRRPARIWPRLLLVAVAAGLTLSALLRWDPYARARARAGSARDTVAAALPAAASPLPQAPVAEAAAGESAAQDPVLARIRQRLDTERAEFVLAEFAAGLQPPADPLARWLDPRNALAELRLGHELRQDSTFRERVLRSAGGHVAADVRVQQIADSLARELDRRLGAGPAPTTAEVGLALRALVAAGGDDARLGPLRRGSAWLAARLPACSGIELTHGVAALLEVAAATGWHGELVAREGARWLDEVLAADDETWGRRLPELLTVRTPVAVLADGGRTAALLPGFGLDAGRCTLLRRLLLGELRERAAPALDPAVLVGFVYGFADLLAEGERSHIEAELRRWKPARLVPDFTTVQQLAWGIEPGRLGYTRLQADLRRMVAVPDPEPLDQRASLCLCLSASYAARLPVALLDVGAAE